MATLRSVSPRALVLGLGLLAVATPSYASRTILQTIRRGFLDVQGGRIYYEATGGGPALVLISGGSGMDLGEWEDQFVPLSSSFDVVRSDPRGLGQSTLPTGPYAPHEDVRALLDGLHIDRAHLVGASSAGRIALDFALAHPERVRSLTLVAPSVSGYEFPEAFRKRDAAFVATLRKDGAAGFAKAVLDDEYVIPGHGSVTVRHRARAMLEDNAPRLLAIDPTWIQSVDPPAFSRLEEVRVPTLVVVGDKDHPDVLKLADIVAGRIPRAKKTVIENAGHTPYMERRRSFNHALLEFLTAVPAQERQPQ